MKIQGSVAFVTGANRGLGRSLAAALLARGAAKVYGGARDPKSIDLPGVIPVKLDVTDPAQVLEAAKLARDATIVINNAGVATATSVLGADAADRLRQELETNLFGPLAVSRAFAPILANNGGGALVNVLSIVSWLGSKQLGTYASTKAAAWSLTNSLRNELRDQGTQVVGVHVGFMETDMAAGFGGPKTQPDDVAARTLAAIEAGELEVLADEASQQVKQHLSAGAYLTFNRV